MIWIIFLLWITTRNALSLTVSWDIGTSVPKFNKELKLTCSVSSDCCASFARIWEIDGVQVLYNGNPPPSSSEDRYREELEDNSSGFSLIIKELLVTDTNKSYDCQYELKNDKHILTQDATWEYQPTEQCPVSNWFFTRPRDFTYDIERSAPYPSFFASVGDKNVTSGLTLAYTKFDIWFYSVKASMDINAICNEEKDEEFKLSVTTGSSTKTVCSDLFICFPCWKCAGLCSSYAILGLVVGYILSWSTYFIGFSCSCCKSCWHIRKYLCFTYDTITEDKTGENCTKLYGKDYANIRRNRALRITACTTLSGNVMFFVVILALFLIGTYCPSCKGNTEYALASTVIGGLGFLFTFCVALKIFNDNEDENYWKQCLCSTGFLVLIILIIPIPILIIIYIFYLKDDSNNKKCLEQCLRFAGIMALSFFIIPIPIMVTIYIFYLKDKIHTTEGERALDGRR